MCFATSARIDSFLALDAKAFSALIVFVVGRNMSVYAAMSTAGGGDLYTQPSQDCSRYIRNPNTVISHFLLKLGTIREGHPGRRTRHIFVLVKA